MAPCPGLPRPPPTSPPDSRPTTELTREAAPSRLSPPPKTKQCHHHHHRVVALTVPSRKVAHLTNPTPALPMRNYCGDSCPQLTGEATRAPGGGRPCWPRPDLGPEHRTVVRTFPWPAPGRDTDGQGRGGFGVHAVGTFLSAPPLTKHRDTVSTPSPRGGGLVGAAPPPGVPGAQALARSAWHRLWVLFRRRQLSSSGTQA